MSRSTDEAKARGLSHAREPAATPATARPGQSLDDVLALNPARRVWLKSGLGAAALSIFGAPALAAGPGDANGTGNPAGSPSAGGKAGADGLDPARDYAVRFQPVARSTADRVIVPPGYEVQVLFSAGDAVETGSASWSEGEVATWEQAGKRAGGDHDGMHYFALPGVDPRKGGLLAINHEQVDMRVFFAKDSFANDAFDEKKATADQKRVALSAVGVSVIEVEFVDQAWRVKRDSPYNRRYTGNSTYAVGGPARERVGATVTGTLNNCSSGATPWGTYLTCEESTFNYFDTSQPRQGYGWVVELDPQGKILRQGVKRTAMGRFNHENVAWLADANGRVAFYMGDDSTPGCIYKFVPDRPFDAADRAANVGLLDEGTLYVAQFNPAGQGRWLPLRHGAAGLTAAEGYPSQADVLVECQKAAVSAGGTVMDRPEWITVGPRKDIYVTLTNYTGRGGKAPVDDANPRAENHHGHIIRWNEAGDSPLAATFTWDIFLLAGDPEQAAAQGKPNLAGNIKGDAFSSPDGLRQDAAGRLWIQTDMNLGTIATSRVFGNNGMYCVDPATGESKRFLVGPVGCELTGIAYTPDLTTFFVNIQHPTQGWPEAGRTPRSSTLAIRRTDGAPVGA
ncbi:dTDP-glucose 4,6-dehydratase [Bordetella genomosp. 9]|uniref:dTDP-glucose 4,6-dehydratase n=1 Tax=Bordetella genomosp. 9 TaxID=1416803 RepID=A0A261RG16_9BORD|nr:PhoX family phosphatase [Bordetella genomosp. 9]OZI23964.1 dTDP-glucose 4,6-dehydratase [Bordetella genomosp. 9]